jgi:DNA-binding SARP family transcriptional activator
MQPDQIRVSGSATGAIKVRLIGSLRVEADGAAILRIPAGRATRLLGLLATKAGRFVASDQIIEELWPGGPPAKAEKDIASLISRLRRVLGRHRIEGGRSGYRMVLSGGDGTDLQDVEQLVRRAEARLAARSLGPCIVTARQALTLLDAGSVLEDELYAPWAEEPRRIGERLARAARRCLWAASLEFDDPASAMAAARAAAEADPLDEEAHRALMIASYNVGDRVGASLAYQQLAKTLADELGVSPSRETQALLGAIIRGDDLTIPQWSEAARPAAALPSGELVGREGELAALVSAWSRVNEGKCRFVFVVGRAGSGKSRLVTELARNVEEGGGLQLRARCHEAERSVFLQPVLEAIRGFAERQNPDLIRALAGNWAGKLVDLLPGLSAVLGEPDYRPAAPEIDHRRALEAVTEFLARLSERQPVLLLLEDLQHAGTSSLEALRFIAGRLTGERLLVVVTIRPEEGDEAMETLEPLGDQIHLGPFSEADVRELAEMAGVPAVGPSVFERTGGDVLFAVEAIRLAVDSGGTSAALAIDGSLRDVALERVRRAGGDVEEFLRVAVILGRSFDLDLIAQVQGVGAEQAARLAERALHAGLLMSKQSRLEFANGVIQEVLYETTPAAVRVSRHRRVADLVGDHPEFAAMHLEAIADWRKACEAWVAAANEAEHAFSNRDAERLFSSALASAEQTGDDRMIARVLLRRGQVREELADYLGASGDHQRALDLARTTGDGELEALALERLGWTAYYARDAESAQELAAQASTLAEEAAAAPAAFPSALVLVGRIRHWNGDLLGAANAYEVALSADAGPRTVASALSCLGALLEHGDRFEQARDTLRRALTECERAGAFRPLLRTLFFAGLARANLGDFAGALRALERKKALLERYDVHFYRARTNTTLSWVWRELGELGRAHELAEEALEQSRRVDGASLQVEQELHALLALAECCLMAGDEPAAASHISEAQPLLRTWMPFRWRAELRLLEVASRLEPDGAEIVLELARQRGSKKYEALALARLGRRREAAIVAAPTGSPLLLAEVAPEGAARLGLETIAAALPRTLRSTFVSQGRLTGPLRR